MSSSGWEVVGKNKKDKVIGKNGKLSKAEKKKFIENAPKVEDFLPLNQVKTLYDNLEGNKENKIPKNKENKTKENEEKKKQQMKTQQQSEKKKQQVKEKPKEKTSKPVEKNTVTVEKINELLDTNRIKYPDAPLLWLKDLVSYVNATIPQEKTDPTFISKLDTYPLSLISKSVRAIFEKVIKSTDSLTIRLFYEGTLLLMVKNMSNETPDMGCKIFIQLLAQMYPEMTTMDIDKHISLRNSYQNKKAIGLSLIWALSQGGKKDLAVGLTLWHKVMSPMLESRTYATHVMKVLKKTLDANKNVNSLDEDLFMEIIDDFYSGKINISNAVDKDIVECEELLRATAMKSNRVNPLSLFENLIEKITPKTSAPMRDEFLRILTACIAAEPKCLSSLVNHHAKRLYQSDLLLKQLDDDWHELCTQVQSAPLKSSLDNIISMEIKTKKAREEALIASCKKRAEVLTRKMTASSKKQRSFPWKKGSLLILLLIGAVVAFDCRKHGSFEASSTGRLVRTSGIVGYGNRALAVTKFYSDKGLAYLEATSPEYYKVAADLTKQYSKLATDFYLFGRNSAFRIYNNTASYVEEKRPIVLASIEEYFPGWIDTFQAVAAKQYEATKKLSAQAGDYIVDQSTAFIRWLETSVFVGNLSPENIRGYANRALESTQAYASQTYDWVYEKVQTLSKVQ